MGVLVGDDVGIDEAREVRRVNVIAEAFGIMRVLFSNGIHYKVEIDPYGIIFCFVEDSALAEAKLILGKDRFTHNLIVLQFQEKKG